MANYLDSLIGRIDDDSLRADLEREVASLRHRKEFGLVFERHLPEKVRLYTHPVKPGVTAQHRAEKDGPLWTVRSTSKGKATLVRSADGEVIQSTVPIDEVVVVREFGQPMYPGLASIGRIERGGARPFHTVIEAENYHGLETLLYAYENKVDCIYIDPPYNTGAKDWKYNNDYVDSNDSYRHSKWLSFMEKRLLLARRLLTPDGVLVVTIDEHEVHRLGVLLDQTMPDARRQVVTIVNNAAGVSQEGFSRVEEYAYFCFLGSAKPTSGADDLLSEDGLKTPIWRPLNRYSGENVSAAKRPGLVYPIGIDETSGRIVGAGQTLAERVNAGKVTVGLDEWRPDPDERLDGHPVIWPWRGDGSLATWELNPGTLTDLVGQGYVRVRPRSATWSISYVKTGNRRKVETGEIPVLGREADNGPLILGDAERNVAPKSVWRRPRHDAGKWGSRTLRELLGNVAFDYAKSPYAVLDTLRVTMGARPDAVILDFFAGSGTTLHSTMMLNAEDGGTRQCILVTNNEVSEKDAAELAKAGVMPGEAEWESRGVCDRVTRPRCTAAITGLRADGAPLEGQYLDGRPLREGFDENVEFLRLGYLDRDEVGLGRAFEAIAPLLWLKAGGIGPQIATIADGWALPAGAAYAVLFDAQRWGEFLDEVHAADGVGHIFVVTDSISVFQQVLAELDGGIEATMLYEDYLSSFAINTGGRG